jgi:hypothetical protein
MEFIVYARKISGLKKGHTKYRGLSPSLQEFHKDKMLKRVNQLHPRKNKDSRNDPRVLQQQPCNAFGLVVGSLGEEVPVPMVGPRSITTDYEISVEN